MTINFENDDNVIVYTLEKVISYARDNQYIFVAQCVWWLASIIGIKEWLVTHIDKLWVWSKLDCAPGIVNSDSTIIHPDRLRQIEKQNSDPDNQIYYDNRESSGSETGLRSMFEDSLHHRILENCEEYLQISERNRKTIARNNLHSSKKLLRKLTQQSEQFQRKTRKNYQDQIQGIERSELDRRKSAGECHRFAWPQDRKGAHKTLDCHRCIRKEKGTAPFSNTRKTKLKE